MLDDFDELDSASFLDDLEVEYDNGKEAKPKRASRSRRESRPERLVFGMLAWQRFVISFLLFGMVFMLGIFFLMVNGSIAPFG